MFLPAEAIVPADGQALEGGGLVVAGRRQQQDVTRVRRDAGAGQVGCVDQAFVDFEESLLARGPDPGGASAELRSDVWHRARDGVPQFAGGHICKLKTTIDKNDLTVRNFNSDDNLKMYYKQIIKNLVTVVN